MSCPQDFRAMDVLSIIVTSQLTVSSFSCLPVLKKVLGVTGIQLPLMNSSVFPVAKLFCDKNLFLFPLLCS